jgi:dTDP-4-amino-4,6-dideoxygalactose transaminase
MVAPVLLANLNVAYFGLRPDGLPNLATIDTATASKTKAMLVSHYFGLANSLAEVRQWCNERGIALIEDCAHCYFGDAGERQVGDWGDYTTASLSKFLPVPEGGLLASAHRPIQNLQLTPQGFKAQIKGWVDVFELASRYKRLPGLNSVMAGIFWLKNPHTRLQAVTTANTTPRTSSPTPDAATLMRDSDMARIAMTPLGATRMLKALLPRGRIIARRQQNFATYAGFFAQVNGARPLFPSPSKAVAPYVFPLWVDDAERVYREVRARDLPVFRWDRIWPGTPHIDGDVGPLWSQHVLQLLCHQDLDEDDIKRTARAILNLLQA